MVFEEPTYGWHAAMIVSFAGFTDPKKTTYQKIGLRRVELRDKDDLLKWLDGYEPNAGGLWVPAGRS